jgi:hypothetical protein
MSENFSAETVLFVASIPGVVPPSKFGAKFEFVSAQLVSPRLVQLAKNLLPARQELGLAKF